MQRENVYPFSAIVGQDMMRTALILNTVHPGIGGVLIRGERGTAKSTAARALAALLPEIEVVADCRFSCDPHRPDLFCDDCRARVARGEELPVSTRRVRIVDLPVSATEDRVVGTLNIERAIQKGERYFDAGILAAANRGILYIDEVNLLDDHVVDLLLDSAAMGINIVEREGFSFQHPARFILVGTMNPEEGDLRPQLLDRFGLSVTVHAISDARQRMAILERRIAYDAAPTKFVEHWRAEDQQLGEKIERARAIYDNVAYSARDLATITTITASFRVDGHRADLVILKTARALAALDGREQVNGRDLDMAMQLALPHRIKPSVDAGKLAPDPLRDQREKLEGEYENAQQAQTMNADASQAKKKLNP
jgi:Mg-chelatase subunit ChlI